MAHVRPAGILMTLFLVGGGCGGGESAGDPDAGAAADAEVAPEPDANPNCLAPAAFGAMGSVAVDDSYAHNQPGSMGARQYYRMTGKLDDLVQFGDRVRLELWDDYGAFLGGTAHAGTFVIEGPETNLDDCGVCLTLRGNDDPNWGPDQLFIATSGTVVVDELADNYAGTITDARFVEIDAATGAEIEGGCTSAIDSASFSAPLVIIPGGGGGGGGGGDGSGGGDGTGDGTGG